MHLLASEVEIGHAGSGKQRFKTVGSEAAVSFLIESVHGTLFENVAEPRTRTAKGSPDEEG